MSISILFTSCIFYLLHAGPGTGCYIHAYGRHRSVVFHSLQLEAPPCECMNSCETRGCTRSGSLDRDDDPLSLLRLNLFRFSSFFNCRHFHTHSLLIATQSFVGTRVQNDDANALYRSCAGHYCAQSPEIHTNLAS